MDSACVTANQGSSNVFWIASVGAESLEFIFNLPADVLTFLFSGMLKCPGKLAKAYVNR